MMLESQYRPDSHPYYFIPKDKLSMARHELSPDRIFFYGFNSDECLNRAKEHFKLSDIDYKKLFEIWEKKSRGY